MEEIQEMIKNSTILKDYMDYSIEELTLMRMYINLDLIWIENEKEKQPEIAMFNLCPKGIKESFLTNILDFRCDIGRERILDKFVFKIGKDYKICDNCKLTKCIKYSLSLFIYAIEQYNEKNNKMISYIDVIDFILKRSVPEFKNIPDLSFFDNRDIIDLMYVHVILEADLIKFKNYDESEGEFEVEYFDIEGLGKQDYLNSLINYFKDNKENKKVVINIKRDIDNNKLSIYELAAYYKYLIEIEKIDIIKALRNLLSNKNTQNGITMRAYYAIYSCNNKINSLPYSENVKKRIRDIFNYVLNYRYKRNTPYIPINVVIYTDDKEIVENIIELISDFMYFFGYLSSRANYYNENIDNLIIDKYSIKPIKEIFYKENIAKNGVILLDNFANLVYVDDTQRTLILNILANEIEKNSNQICTFIYGNKSEIERILNQYNKFKEKIINVELDIEELSSDKVYELVINKLEENCQLSDEVKEKINHYVKATYNRSLSKNLDYANKLYNEIILNKTKRFNIKEDSNFTLEDIPERFNERDLKTILKELNELTGLANIKMQVNDLVSLLKFNKKTQINLTNLNLHMIFTGNPGTGKTTVARLITDILFNLEYISQNRLTEVTPRELIGEYVGQTAGKTYNVVKSALGGVLFIDEAYSITMGEQDYSASYGSECIATLLKLMEDYKDNLVIIFAGYKKEMESFVKVNSGLASRIGYKIDFPDYSLEELYDIFLKLLKTNNMEISEEALKKIKIIIRDSSKIKNFGNARYISNLYQKLLIEHAKNEEINDYKEDINVIKEKDANYDKLMADNVERKIGF